MFRGDRRGVSEVLGFVLVFSLVIASVGVVFTVGLGGLQDARDTERVNNAERAFDVLADNLNSLVTGDAPNRATEIRLAGASLSIETAGSINVTVSDGEANTSTGAIGLREIRFDNGRGERVTYAGGAVFRESDDSAVMVVDPPFLLGGDRVLVPIVQLGTGPSPVSGTRVVQVRAERDIRSLHIAEPEPEEVTIEVRTDRRRAWKRYFEERGFDDCQVDDGVVCSDDDLERVDVTFVRIEATFA